VKRRDLLVATAGALASVSTAGAQPVRKRRIGIFLYSANDAFEQGFLKALREAGYVDGQNVDIIRRDAKANNALLQQYADELVREQVDVIVVWSTDTVTVAMRATSTIPIVGSLADPLRSGLVKSLARPEANFTGISSQAFDISAKRIDLLIEALPGVARLAFLGLRGEANMRGFFDTSREAANKAGVEMMLAEVTGPQDLERAITAAAQDGAQGLALQQIFYPQSKAIAELALRVRLPTIGWQRPFAEAGGLMAFGVVQEDSYRLLARYVDRVLAGVPVANLPIEQGMRSNLIVNQRTAKLLGVPLPMVLLARADEVIE
jgi:putative tryptophan/tyrosine transport system substrate-binding protein